MNANEGTRTSSAPQEPKVVMTVDEAAAKFEQRQHEARQPKPEKPAKAAPAKKAAVPEAQIPAARAEGLKKTAAAAKAKVAAAARKPGAGAKGKSAKKAAAPKAGGERKPKGLTLRAEVNDVLRKLGKGKPMTVAAIATAITERGVYKRPNGKPVSPGHIAFLAIRSEELTYGKGGTKTNVGLAPAKK